MKLPYYTACLILLFFCVQLSAQKIIKEGVLSYYETRATVGRTSGKPVIRTTLQTASFSPNVLKLHTELRKNVVNTTITTCGEAKSTSFLSNGKDYYALADVKNSQFVNMGNYSLEQSTIAYSEETAVIANYNCKKAVMTAYADGQKEEIDIWYTPDVQIDPGCFSFFFQQLKGLPVSFVFKEHPKVSIGGIAAANIEYLLAGIKETSGAKLDTVADEQKYVVVNDENEKRNIAIQMLLGSATPVTHTGTAITETLGTGSTSITVTRYNPFTVGNTLPSFEGNTLTHTAFSADSLQGKPAVLNFWFTGCGPCIKEMPLLNRVAAQYAGSVAFVAITRDEAATVTDFLKTHVFSFTQLVGAKAIIDKMGVSSYPTTVLTDAKGIIRFVKVGGFTDEAELTKAIDALAH